MKQMRKLFYIVPLILSAMLLASCDNDDDGYSLNDYWLTTATFKTTADYYYVVTDGGDVLWPSASNIHAIKHDDGDRIFVNYTILQDAPDSSAYDYYVKVNSTSSILTKELFTFTSETTDAVKDSIGNDAITIVDTWFTDNYLNIEFEYGGGYGIHFISLVKDEMALKTDDGEIILELKHSKNGDPYSYKQWGIASFDLSELQEEGIDSTNIYLRAINKEGEYQYNKVLTYDYRTEDEASILSNRQLSGDKKLEDALIK